MHTQRFLMDSDTARQRAGAVLVLIGLGWLGVAQLPAIVGGSIEVAVSLIGGALSGVVVSRAATGLGMIHLLFGGLLLVRRRTGKPDQLSFWSTIGVGTVAFLVSGAVVVSPDVISGGTVTVGMVGSFPVFVCYIAAWLFPLGIAADRNHRLVVLALWSVVPVFMLLAIPLLILSGGGWLILILMFSLPAVFAILLLTAVCGLPLVFAGRLTRLQSIT